MADNIFRQKQSRKTDTFNDQLAAGPTLESASTDLESDLNAIRSQINRILDATGSGTWTNDIPTVLAAKRGLLQLATDTFGQTGPLADVHRTYDQLVHAISENSFQEIIRDTNDIVTDIIIYTDATKTIKIREKNITRTQGQISQVVTKQFDISGAVFETQTEVISRTNGVITDITMTLT